ncbi:MAG: hypothetical protein HYY22_09645 [Thaumarchaeota archaeon]|nr:hypothetical protein [Nitrososphaerota archaeon]
MSRAEDIARIIGLDLTQEQLAFIGLGSVLSRVPALDDQKWTLSGNLPEVHIEEMKPLGKRENVYKGCDANCVEKWTVRTGTRTRLFRVYKDIYSTDGEKQNLVVVKSPVNSGSWKAKDFTLEDGKWTTKAWGVTSKVKERHRFDEFEARDLVRRLERALKLSSDGKTWKIILENDREDFVKAWLLLWNQV